MAIVKYHALANITVGQPSATITFDSIPAEYRDLRVVANVIGVNAALDSDYVKFNGSTADFTTVQLYGNGSSASSNTGTSGRVSNYENTVGRPYIWTLDIIDYSQTSKHKTYLSRYNSDDAGLGSFAGRWAQLAAVTTVQIYPGSGAYAAGSTFTLYGVK
jgi:hypothetical protein